MSPRRALSGTTPDLVHHYDAYRRKADPRLSFDPFEPPAAGATDFSMSLCRFMHGTQHIGNNVRLCVVATPFFIGYNVTREVSRMKDPDFAKGMTGKKNAKAEKDAFVVNMGKRIREKRARLGFSQDELAIRADISKQTVSRAETGERELGAQNAAKVARALEMSVDYMFSGKRTDKDLSILSKKVAGLPDREFNCLEDIINAFVEMCDEKP